MSADSSKIDGCKPLLAEERKEEASTNKNCNESEEQQSGNDEILQLPESSNDPSIPTIKLGGESMRLMFINGLSCDEYNNCQCPTAID